jgi:hypothetical protein
MSNLYERIVDAINILRDDLEKKGLTKEYIDTIIGDPSKPYDKSENSDMFEGFGNRRLGSVVETCNTSHNAGTNALSLLVGEGIHANAEPKQKYPQKWTGQKEVVIVLDYTDKSHAVFGDFGKTHVSFKDNYLKQNKHFSYHGNNNSLQFGAGWTMRDKTKLDDLRKALKKANIPFREVNLKDYLKEMGPKEDSQVVEVSSESEHEKSVKSKISDAKGQERNQKTKEVKETKELGKVELPKDKKVLEKNTNKASNTKTEEIKSKIAGTSNKPETKTTKTDESEKPKRKIRKNAFGNYEEDETGLVFMKIPVGPKGKEINVCVGYQNPMPEKGCKGHETVFALTDDHRIEAENNSHKVLTEAMIDKIRVDNKDLADILDEITLRDANQDNFDSDSDDIDSDDDTDDDSDLDDDDSDM